MKQFLIVIEKAGRNYSAYSPDLPGCVATGRTRKQTEVNMHTAIQMHVSGLREDRQPVPVPQASAAYVLTTEPRPHSGRSHTAKPSVPR